VTTLLVVMMSATASEVRIGFESVSDVGGNAALLVGKPSFVPGREGQGLRLSAGAHVRFEARDAFRADAGTIEMWVKPEWDGKDEKRHAFFHTGGGNLHVTLFSTGGGKLIFVYKASARAWHGTSLSIAHWRANTWHHVRASWRTTASGKVACVLGVDGDWTSSGGATLLPSIPQHLFLGGRGEREPADAVIDEVRISSEFSLPELPKPAATTIPMRVDAARPSGPMPRTWSFVTPWNSRTYRIPFTQEHPYFRRFKEAGFEMVRMVAFSEGWLWGTEVTRDADGKLRLNFSDFDTMVDVYRTAGAEPYIRLAYHMPKVMGKNSYSPPHDMDEWVDFVKRIVRHCTVERKLGIRYWVTMLNEADIWIRRGDAQWEPMLDLYEKTTRAVLEIDPDAKVGGPATCGPLPGSQEDALRRFVQFCKQKDLPPDFICFHAYHRPKPGDYETATLAAKRAVESVWPELKPEYFLDEWNLWGRDKTQDNEYGAAYIASAIHYQIRAGLTRSSIVSFNTHFPPDEITGNGQTFTGPFHKAPGRSARFYEASHTLKGRERKCLYTHAPPKADAYPTSYTFGRFRVRVPEDAVLRTATALAFEYETADGVGMEVHVLDGQRDVPLLQTLVTKPEWQEHALSLSEFAGREVSIEFRTDCGPGTSIAADHGLWAEPRIEAAGRIVHDFCAKLDGATTGWWVPRAWHKLGTKLPMIKGHVVTPVYFTYWLYNRLRGERLPVRLDGRDGIHESDTTGALACRDGSTIRVLLWHFDAARARLAQHFDTASIQIPREIRIRIDGLAGKVRIRQYLIDHDHTNAYTDYVVKGKPDGDGKYNLDTGRADVVIDTHQEARDGVIEIVRTLRNMSVSLVELQGE